VGPGAIVLLTAATAASAAPPSAASAPALVEVDRLDSTLRLDVRYATANNFVGRAVYPAARALLVRPVAEALIRVHRALEGRGYGLVVFDAYRPWSVTKLFWDALPPEKRRFVAPPSRGSNHNRACAVDLSLFERATGREAVMPSAYDEMSERASPRYAGGDVAAREHRDLLRAAMEAEGFRVDKGEWWHFNHRTCPEYPIQDVPLLGDEGRRRQ
jgi:D-alanyl-D-alanine dipeptidase